MKKLLILLVILFNYYLLRAQLIDSYGLKFGVVNAKQNYEKGEKDHPEIPYEAFVLKNARIAFEMGIFFQLKFSNYLYLTNDIIYIQKGGREFVTYVKSKDLNDYEKYWIDNNLDYLQYSPQIKIKIRSKQIKPYVMIGPTIDYLLFAGGIRYIPSNVSFNFGGNFGLGVELEKFFKNSIQMEIIYNRDFNYVFKSDYYKYKNRTIQLRIGINL